MKDQYEIDFNAMALEGEQLMQEGLQRAVDNANKKNDKWSDRSWELFKSWLHLKPAHFEFMMEDFRLHLERNGKIETPPSKRAYGFIPLKALREGLIERYGMGHVQNENAHMANATVWIKIIK